VKWSPDGYYLAVGGDNDSNHVVVYGWHGNRLVDLGVGTKLSQADVAYSLQWSIEGDYLVVGRNSVHGAMIYSWDEYSLTLTSSITFPSTADVRSIAWTRDKNYMSVAGELPGSIDLRVYGVNEYTYRSYPASDTGLIWGDSLNGSASDIDIFVLSGATLDIYGTVLYDNV
jgi:WD40 repeat protein